MILHTPRARPQNWAIRKQRVAVRWLRPLILLEWVWEWIAYGLSNWAFLEVLEYLGSFSVLIAVIFYFSESGDRVKQRHYQAWQVINTAQGKGGSGGRIEALQELNEDKVPLVGVDVSSAFLQGLHLEHASLLRSDFSAADLRNGVLSGSNLALANLNSANLRYATLTGVQFVEADLRDVDMTGANLAGANFSGAMLDGADLRGADLKNVEWQHIGTLNKCNVAGVKNAPPGFVDWALGHGAIADGGAN